MSKEFINEVNRMKDLFGYKKGQVISEQLTAKQQEASDAGWGPVTDEYAKSLPVDSRGKIIPKQAEKENVDKPLGRGQGAGSIYSGEYKFVKFPCLNPEWKQSKNYDNQQKTDGAVTTYLQGEGNDKDKVGNKLSEILFSEKGEYYVRGQRAGKFSCSAKNEILLDDIPMIKDVTPVVKTLPNVTVYTKPKELKNVKEFQDCLDRLHSGWYKGSNLNKGPGYGKFGPNTSKAWGKYKNDYLTGACSKFNRGGLGVPTEDGGETLFPTDDNQNP
jgi:hypothetical protein